MAGSLQDVVAQEVQLQVEESSRSTSSEDTRERKLLMENEAYRCHLLLRCGVPTTLPIKLTGGQRVSKLHDVLARTAVGKATARSYQALYKGVKLMRAELIGLGLTELPQGSRTFMSKMEVCEVMLAKFEMLVVHQEGVTISDADLAAIQGAIHSDLTSGPATDALSTILLQHHRLPPPFGSGEALDVPDIPTVAALQVPPLRHLGGGPLSLQERGPMAAAVTRVAAEVWGLTRRRPQELRGVWVQPGIGNAGHRGQPEEESRSGVPGLAAEMRARWRCYQAMAGKSLLPLSSLADEVGGLIVAHDGNMVKVVESLGVGNDHMVHAVTASFFGRVEGCPRLEELLDVVAHGVPVKRQADFEAEWTRGSYPLEPRHVPVFDCKVLNYIALGRCIVMHAAVVRMYFSTRLHINPVFVVDEGAAKFRVVHDLSALLHGESVDNNTTVFEDAPVVECGHIFEAMLYRIWSLRQAWPRKRILISKMDVKSAFRQLALDCLKRLEALVCASTIGVAFVMMNAMCHKVVATATSDVNDSASIRFSITSCRSRCIMEFERLRQLALKQHVTEVAARTVELKAGASALAYIEKFGPSEITLTNFLAGKIEVKKNLVEVSTVDAKDPGSKHRPDDIYRLTEEGQQDLADGKDLQVLSYNLHCGGGNRGGVDGASGANCARDPCKGKYCSSTTGSCEEGCAWAAMTSKKRGGRPGHYCRFRMVITATSSQVDRRVIQLLTVGEHTRDTEWIPVAADRLTMSLPLRNDIIRLARAGPAQRSTIAAQAAIALPDGLAATSRTVPRRDEMTQMVAYDRKLSHGKIAGSFTAVDSSIGARHLSLSSPLPPNINRDGVIVLFYRSGADRTMQIVVTTPEALTDAHAHARSFVMSDAKHDTSDTHAPWANILCPAPGGGTLPLVVSISSTENGLTTAQMALSLQMAVPCGNPACMHPFVEETSIDGSDYQRWRPCATTDLFVPMVGIDKSSTLRDAFASVGMTTSVCVFHNFQAIIKNLQTKKNVPRDMLAVFDKVLHVLFRAQTAEVCQSMLGAVLDMVRAWGEAKLLGKAPIDDVINYLQEALGLAGTAWQGTMGDFVGLNVTGHQSTNNSAELHFRLLDRCLLQDTASTNFVDLVELVLGVTAGGATTQHMSYFRFMTLQRQDRELKGGARTAGDVLRRSLDGRWLNLIGHVTPAAPGGKYFYVTAGVQRITRDSQAQGLRETARLRETTSADLTTLYQMLKPVDAPAERAGFYIVDPVADTCFLCSDFQWRGNSSDGCQHIHAGKAFIGAYGDVTAQQTRVQAYVYQMERRKSVGVPRDDVLYDTASNWEQVKSQLLLGVATAAPAAPAPPSEFTVTLAAGVACDILLRQVTAVMRENLGLEDVYSIARGCIAGGKWVPELPHARDMLPHDIILRVGDVDVVSDATATAARVQLMDTSSIRVMRVMPIIPTKKRDAPSMLGHLPNARQPGMGRAYRRKKAAIDPKDVMRPQDAQTDREKGRTGAAGKR
ncbi:hypothetical protein JKP88DRAFT_246102 [Tribonema minus]|uniref:Uncharacterized protein n=1 Tax=Tribonema minus TaxID=303371 RepID=A0A836CCV7_9STRA|nr:hypothetical protein JKP88DRAFT_246102 [Tribonema minus]